MNPRILVVEDERAIQIALSGLLTRVGYDVEVAGDGASAIRLLEAGGVDLVLTDLALGRDAVVALRGGWRFTPSLTLTAALDNLADKDYRVHGSGLNEPGRNLILAAEYSF